jgi:hypothetical protein
MTRLRTEAVQAARVLRSAPAVAGLASAIADAGSPLGSFRGIQQSPENHQKSRLQLRANAASVEVADIRGVKTAHFGGFYNLSLTSSVCTKA